MGFEKEFDDDGPVFRPIHDDGGEDPVDFLARMHEKERIEKLDREVDGMIGISIGGKKMNCCIEKGRDGHAELATAPMTERDKGIFLMASKVKDLLAEGLSEEGKTTPMVSVLEKSAVLLDRIIREVTGGLPVQTFEIWREGFDDGDGEKEPAIKLADGIPGSDFPDAVEFWYNHTPDAEHFCGPLVFKGEGEKRKAWLWGCRLYDNEADARKRFG